MALEKMIYEGTFIHCASLTELDIVENGIIGVDEHGKIAFIRRNSDESGRPKAEGWEAAKTVKIQDHRFFFPGFIGKPWSSAATAEVVANDQADTHIHASQYPNAGVFGKSTLLDWLNMYTFPMESSFRDLQKAARVYNRVVARTLSHGTTTACYYATIHVPATNLLADICQIRGQRAFVGRVCMSELTLDHYKDKSTESALRDTQSCIDHIKQIDPGYDLVTPIITPRFAPSCTTETLSALGRLHHETGLPCQTHMSENLPECRLVKELFPNSKSYADVYDSTGLLTSKMILAHCVHLSPEEQDLIKARDTKISHCPASNTSLTSGTAKIRQLLNKGITVGLGTDVSGGYTSSMLVEAREALFVSRHVAMTDGDAAKLSVEEALYLATRGGAKVVGLEDRIGGFEVGKDWDAQMISLNEVDESSDLDQSAGPVEIFGGEDWDTKIAKWVYTGDDRNTMAVWVKGRLVHSRRTLKP